jgi:hypothetical protein
MLVTCIAKALHVHALTHQGATRMTGHQQQLSPYAIPAAHHPSSLPKLTLTGAVPDDLPFTILFWHPSSTVLARLT